MEIALAATLAAFWSGVLATSAWASIANCSTHISGQGAGYTYHKSTAKAYGVQSSVQMRDTSICTSQSASFEYSWIAIDVLTNGTGIAQIGFFTQNQGCFCWRWAWEIYDETFGADTRTLWGSPVLDAFTDFKVAYSFTNDRLEITHSTDGGTTWVTPPDHQTPCFPCHPHTEEDPVTTWGWMDIQLGGEIYYAESDIAGITNYKTNFEGLQQKGSGGGWSTTDLTTSNWSTISAWCYLHQVISPSGNDHARTWTAPTTHNC